MQKNKDVYKRQACGVSVGCIYNYFASKTELLSATVESIWSDIFHHTEDEVVFQDVYKRQA